MSGIACHHCGAETSNGLALCGLCQRKVSTDLEFLPVYFRNLARWRPGRAGSRPVPGSRVLYDGTTRGSGTGDRISDALDHTMTALTTWARALADDRLDHEPRPLPLDIAALTGDLPPEIVADDQAQVTAWLCAALEYHLTSVATLEWCGEFVRDMGHHEARLRGFTESFMPGWYAGACRRQVTMEARCGTPTYVVPGLTWVTCGGCGATTYARDHLDMVIVEARDWVGRPKALAQALVALVDTELSVPRLYERIRKWEQRGKIEGIQRTERGHVWSDEQKALIVADEGVGPKRYRLGDVLTLLLIEGETRPSSVAVKSAATA